LLRDDDRQTVTVAAIERALQTVPLDDLGKTI
jgi:hypothetical protein